MSRLPVLKTGCSCSFCTGKNTDKPKCLDCGKQLSVFHIKRCSVCWYKFARGDKAINWRGGRTVYCLTCGKKLSRNSYGRGSKYCKKHCPRPKPQDYGIKKKGTKNPNWNGGISKLPYSFKFDQMLKESIRKRDSHICQLCSRTQEEELKQVKRILSIHHIDYDKQNCEETNLTTLCVGCNAKVNFNREHWKLYFTLLLAKNRIETCTA